MERLAAGRMRKLKLSGTWKSYRQTIAPHKEYNYTLRQYPYIFLSISCTPAIIECKFRKLDSLATNQRALNGTG